MKRTITTLALAASMMLLTIPGKYRFEKWLVGRRFVLRPINWLRRRAHREPLRVTR